MNDKDQVYAYFYRSRPPSMFVQPPGFNPDTQQTYFPRKTVLTHFAQERPFHGRIEYDRPLNPNEIYKFELWPEDPIQYALYKAWEEVRRGGDLYTFKSYAKAWVKDLDNPDLLDDHTAMVMKVLLDAGYDFEAIESKFQRV